jgi:hypothetical protein
VTAFDRIGFQYERRVGLADYVSQKQAARLLKRDLATVVRWTTTKRLRSRRLNGYVVIQVREISKASKRLGIRLDTRGLLIERGADGDSREWIKTGG